MKTVIIVQPTRFEIREELGCASDIYSYVGYYIIYYAPSVICSLGCVILARKSLRGDDSSKLILSYDCLALTLRTFLRHRKEMNEFLSSSRDVTHSKYSRLMLIACLDTLFNLPVLITITVIVALQGKDNDLNYPYIGWKNVHDGAGGNFPGLSLSSIVQTPASEWSADGLGIFGVKWDEWLYVLHAVTFFGVFGTTPEIASALPIRVLVHTGAAWVQKASRVRSGDDFGRRLQLESGAANGNPFLLPTGEPVIMFFLFKRQLSALICSRQASLSFLEAAVDKSTTHSGEIADGNNLESGITTTGNHYVIETVAFVEGDEK